MKIEYLAGVQPHVEHVEEPELSRWTAEHPQAVIVHATPEHEEEDQRAGGS